MFFQRCSHICMNWNKCLWLLKTKQKKECGDLPIISYFVLFQAPGGVVAGVYITKMLFGNLLPWQTLSYHLWVTQPVNVNDNNDDNHDDNNDNDDDVLLIPLHLVGISWQPSLLKSHPWFDKTWFAILLSSFYWQSNYWCNINSHPWFNNIFFTIDRASNV